SEAGAAAAVPGDVRQQRHLRRHLRGSDSVAERRSEACRGAPSRRPSFPRAGERAGPTTRCPQSSEKAGPIRLGEAHELTLLIAREDPSRHLRVAARWLLRYLEECDDATIDEAAMVAACFAALSGDCHRDAALILQALAE